MLMTRLETAGSSPGLEQGCRPTRDGSSHFTGGPPRTGYHTGCLPTRHLESSTTASKRRRGNRLREGKSLPRGCPAAVSPARVITSIPQLPPPTTSTPSQAAVLGSEQCSCGRTRVLCAGLRGGLPGPQSASRELLWVDAGIGDLLHSSPLGMQPGPRGT